VRGDLSRRNNPAKVIRGHRPRPKTGLSMEETPSPLRGRALRHAQGSRGEGGFPVAWQPAIGKFDASLCRNDNRCDETASPAEGDDTKKAARMGGLSDSILLGLEALPHHDSQAQEAEAQKDHRAGLGNRQARVDNAWYLVASLVIETPESDSKELTVAV